MCVVLLMRPDVWACVLICCAVLGSKAIGTFTSAASGKAESLLMSGNFFDTTANIVDESTGKSVARIDRSFLNARELLGGQQTYGTYSLVKSGLATMEHVIDALFGWCFRHASGRQRNFFTSPSCKSS